MKKQILTILSLLLIVTACTKEGPAGKDGKDGADGNANVHSTEVTVYTTDWQQGDGGLWATGKSIQMITQSVVDNGTVIIYIKMEKDQKPFYVAIPYKDLTYIYGVGGFILMNSSKPTSQLTFKVVVIDGTVPSNVDLADYNAVMGYYNSNDK